MDLIEEQLSRSKTIAVVGLSPSPDRPSHYVAKYLQEQGSPANKLGRAGAVVKTLSKGTGGL